LEQAVSYYRKQAIFFILLTVILVLAFDQSLKIYIKTNLYLGQENRIIGDWFRFHFTENPGMAFGIIPFGGSTGKIILTVFRLLASGVIIYYLRSLVREKASLRLVILVSLILAGALGNIIDSLFYGLIFSSSDHGQLATLMPEEGGYAGLFMGKVVDMLYFPLIDTQLPEWLPFKGGERFEFFRPVFNVADSAISIGVFTIILFRKKLFMDSKEEKTDELLVQDSSSTDDDLPAERNSEEPSF
jgi:signal peptidase II